VDHQRLCDFFDGASKNRNNNCGGGVVLHMSYHVSLKIRMGLGPGKNNFAELMSLKLFLIFSKEKNVNSIQIFGDSQFFVKWV